MKSVIAFAVLLGVATAPAHAAPKPKDPGDVAYQEGRRHYDLREWDAAIASFKESYRLRADEPSLFNIAQSYRLKGDCVEALGFYQTYKRNFPDAPGIAAVDKLLVDVEACAREKTAAAAAKPAPPTTEPTVTPTVTPAQPVPAQDTDAAPGHKLRITGGVLGAVGVVSLVGGTLFALHSSSISKQVESGSGSFDPSLQADGKAADRDATIAFVAGGALVATGVVLYLVGRSHESAHIAIVPTPTGGSVTWQTSF